jgi:hypothetical protein
MKRRMYGLFEKVEGRWVRRFPELAFPKQTAVRFFQNELLAPYLGCGSEVKGIRELRPVR